MIFKKGASPTKEKRQSFKQMMLVKLDIHMQKKRKKKKNLDPYLILYQILTQNINSRWIKDLNVRAVSMKLWGENIGGKLMILDLAVISGM